MQVLFEMRILSRNHVFSLRGLHVIWLTYFFLIPNEAAAQSSPPTLRISTMPLSNAIEVFIEETNCSTVTQWLVEYREAGNNASLKNISTRTDFIASVRIDGLQPNTNYQIRARASQLYGTTAIAEGDSGFSLWTSSKKTAPLTVFGSVVLNSVTYTPQHAVQYSAEWNSSLAIIENGYSSIPNKGISIIRIENSGGNARVHYRIDVEETSLDTSSTKYVLSGSDFTDSFVNSGDKPLGTAYIEQSGNKWTLFYLPDSSCTGKLVERYMMVSPDDEDTFEIHLNVASSDATTADEEDGLRIGSDGSLKRDDGISSAQISLGTVIGLTPRFLIKDCLVGQPSVALYSEVFEPTVYASTEKISHIYEYIAATEVTLDPSSVTYTSSYSGTSVVLHIPAVEKAIKYEVLNASSVTVATYSEDSEEEDFCPSIVNITVSPLEEGRNYTFTVRTTTRRKDATTPSKEFGPFYVVPTASITTAVPVTTAVITSTTTAVGSSTTSTSNPTSESLTSAATERSSIPTEAITTTSQTSPEPSTTENLETTAPFLSSISVSSTSTVSSTTTTQTPATTTTTSQQLRLLGLPLYAVIIIIIVGVVFVGGAIGCVIYAICSFQGERRDREGYEGQTKMEAIDLL